MDQKEEFENLIKDADQSREKSLILLICATKSLASLENQFERQQFDEEETKQMNQLLDCVDNLIDLWLNKLTKGEINLDEIVELIEESELLNVFVNLFYRCLTEKFIKIEQILHKTFANLPIAKKNQIVFHLYLMVIAQRFKDENGLEKFELSKRLRGYLSKNLNFCLENPMIKNCIKVLADCSYNVIQNKLSDELRSPIFSLLATITYHYETLNWFIKPEDERRSFLLISRLACIESRMCLDLKFHSGAVQLNDLNLLTNSLIIVEYSLKSLIEEEEDEKIVSKNVMDYLTSEDVIELIDAIKLLMQSIIIHLIENQNLVCGKDSKSEMDDTESSQADCQKDEKLNYDKFQACLRVLCLYLSFENEFLKDDFEKILNIISKYILNELSKAETRNDSLINLCLTALISIIDNDLQKYKEQLIKLGLICSIESQMKIHENSKENCKAEMFKTFLDSIANC